jgi:hypothetical protein
VLECRRSARADGGTLVVVLGFFVDAVLTGRVLGIDASATPEGATSVLGDDYAENQFYDDAMWRDYGVVEVAWTRRSAADPWHGHHISIQTHRLGGDDGDDPMNANVRAVYGEFRTRLRFDGLQEGLSAHDRVLIPAARPHGDVLEFVHPRAGASVLVASAARTMGLDEGDVYTIVLSGSAPA